MKFTFPLFIFFILLNCSNNNPNVVSEDSSNQSLKITDSLFKLSKNESLNISERIQFLDQAIQLSEANQSDSLLLKYISYKTAIYSNNRDYENAKKHTLNLLKQAENKKDTFYIAKSFYKLGLYHNKESNYDSAFAHYNKSKKMYASINDSINTAILLHKMAILKSMFGDISGSETLSISALKYLTNKKQQSIKYKLFLLLGITSKNQKDFQSAENWYNKAIQVAKTAKDSCIVYNSIGVLTLKKEDYKSSIKHFTNSVLYLQTSKKYSKRLLLTFQDNLAYAEGLSGNKNAIQNILKIRTQKESINDLAGCFASNIHLASLYKKQNNLKLVEDYSKQAFNCAEKVSSTSAKIEALGYLIDSKVNNTTEARLFKKLTDSVNNANSQLKNTFDKIEYETFEKENENLKLKQDKAQQELELEKENKRKWFFASGFLAAVASLGVFGFYYRRNQRQKRIIEDLQREMHHRVKNNLATIDTFIEFAKDEFNDDAFTNKLTELQNRIESINEVHSQLYLNKDVTNLSLSNYVSTLVNNVEQSFNNPKIKVTQNIDQNITIPANKAFPLGLIVNEFITNSFKYAYNNTSGIIFIEIKDNKNNFELFLSDDGKGLPTDFDIDTVESFGMRIMYLLSEQLNATFDLDGTNGVRLIVKIPK